MPRPESSLPVDLPSDSYANEAQVNLGLASVDLADAASLFYAMDSASSPLLVGEYGNQYREALDEAFYYLERFVDNAWLAASYKRVTFLAERVLKQR